MAMTHLRLVQPRPFVLTYLTSVLLLVLGSAAVHRHRERTDRFAAACFSACSLVLAWLCLPCHYPPEWEAHRPCLHHAAPVPSGCRHQRHHDDDDDLGAVR